MTTMQVVAAVGGAAFAAGIGILFHDGRKTLRPEYDEYNRRHSDADIAQRRREGRQP